MTWWDNFSAEFVANLLSGAMVIAVALYIENALDEARTRRQDAREKRRKHE